MKITMEFEDGATNDVIAATLRMRANLFEGMEPKRASRKKNTAAMGEDEFEDAPDQAPDDEFEEAEVEDDFEDESSDEFEDEIEDDFEEPPAKKKASKKKASKKAAKKKAPTIDDLNDACKKYAHEHSRGEVMKILKKFKVKSLTSLKPAQYQAVLNDLAL